MKARNIGNVHIVIMASSVMDKKQEKKIWNSQLAIENPKNDRIAVIYSVKVSSVRILEKPRNPKRGKTR